MASPEEGAHAQAAQSMPSSKRLVTITSHGITVQVDQDTFNDLELFDMIDEIQSGNVFKMPKLLQRIFDDQYEAVLDGLRAESGIATAEVASEFLVEVLQQAVPNS
ncbi:MAG: hypothetical protein FWD93_05260 [Coriobacteriia bacterium]|nr:hypothetical protein [Coriobacteriia bacterium]